MSRRCVSIVEFGSVEEYKSQNSLNLVSQQVKIVVAEF